MGRPARITVAVLAATLPVAMWMGCVGDDPSTSPGADSGVADGPVDASAPDTSALDGSVGDAGSDSSSTLCDAAVPGTGNRILQCGAVTCNLDQAGQNPPLSCCIGADPSSGTCISRNDAETCPSPKVDWVCSRSFQCPFPSPCCLSTPDLSSTCPATATMLETDCRGDGDGGCPAGNIELCTGPEPCKNGKTCQVLQILNGDKRVVGACL